MKGTIVVGLDGGAWSLINPWIGEGHLPNIASVKEDGVWAETRSCLPPSTFPNWKCYSASKNPGNLGVFWFERIDLEEETVEVPNGSSFDTAEIWDYVNRDGGQVGVVNMPTMYPPREIDGFVVAGGPDAVDGEYRSIDSGYTWPADLEDDLEERYGYRVHPDPLLSSNDERGEEVDEILDLIDTRFQVARDLYLEENLELVHVTLFYLNVLQHFFWNEEPTRRAWELVDDWIGRLDDLEDTNVVLMSDHGCAETTGEFYVNEWLAANGHLVQRRTIEDALQRVGMNRENALAVAKRLGIVDVLSRLVPERFQKMVPQEAGVKRERKLEKIDLDRTAAVASGQGPIYLNDAVADDATRREIAEGLRGTTDEAGDPLFKAVHTAEDVYSGIYLDDGPDLVVDQRDGITVNDGLGGGKVLTEPDRWRAENVKHGLFAAKGPDFEDAGRIDRIAILDIAPTLLAAHGINVPADMEGEVLPILTDVEPTDVDRTDPIDVERQTSLGSEDEVADRLTELGYME